MIIIDEVSMVQSDLIDHIDFALKKALPGLLWKTG